MGTSTVPSIALHSPSPVGRACGCKKVASTAQPVGGPAPAGVHRSPWCRYPRALGRSWPTPSSHRFRIHSPGATHGRSTPTRTPTACSASSTLRQPSTALATTLAAVAAVAFCRFIAARWPYAFAPEKLGAEVAGHRAAGVLRPHRAAGDRGRRRQDRRIRRQGGGDVPFSARLSRQRHQHGRAHAHGPVRDSLPGHPGVGAPPSELGATRRTA